jgi:hypothetical protein
MPPASPRSRISRETRLLLLTVLLSVGALLVLARIRFPERPATPALLPPLLTQLSPPSVFQEMSRAVSALEAEVTPILEPMTIEETAAGAPRVGAALRFRPDAAAALLGDVDAARISGVINRDRATGLTIIGASAGSLAVQRIWTSQQDGYPRYVLVTEASTAGAGLRPVFLGPLPTDTSFAWECSVWTIPRHLDVRSGSFVFTSTAAFAGLVVDHANVQAIVPPEAVLALAERLRAAEPPPPGWIGLAVQDLTGAVASATSAASGVIVASVDDGGPAARLLHPTDVVEQMNSLPIANRMDWDARLARVAAGERLDLQVRRGGQIVRIDLVAAPPPAPRPASRLGLTLRSRPRIGALVTLVEEGSVAGQAGIAAGDVLVRVGDVSAPGATQVLEAFDALPSGGSLLVAIARGNQHSVIALVKP